MIGPIASDDALFSGAAALIFAAIFLLGHRFHPFRRLTDDRRGLISFAAGSSAAYVFVYLMPELDEVRHSFLESANIVHRFEGMAIYYIALLGFLCFYGLEHLRIRFANRKQGQLNFRVQVGGFAAYVCLVSYLVLSQLEEGNESMLLYTAAMSLHFLSVDYSLREEYGSDYENVGRWLLAGMTTFGWALSVFFVFSGALIALLTAFLSGAVIMNSMLAELPKEKDGRFLPFVLGGLIYGAILLPLY
jgi:hypothetical protein